MYIYEGEKNTENQYLKFESWRHLLAAAVLNNVRYPLTNPFFFFWFY